jgi:hypothetical protein
MTWRLHIERIVAKALRGWDGWDTFTIQGQNPSRKLTLSKPEGAWRVGRSAVR